MRGKIIHWAALLVVPLLFLLFAGRYAVLHERYDLSPGVGGGLAVFSELDTRLNRSLKIELLTEKGAIPVTLPGSYDAAVKSLIWLPREPDMEVLATRLLTLTWGPTEFNTFLPMADDVKPDATGVPALGFESRYRPIAAYEPDPGELALDLQGIRLEVRTLKFDAEGNELAVVPLRSVTVMRGNDDS
jgi:hypothetical protein